MFSAEKVIEKFRKKRNLWIFTNKTEVYDGLASSTRKQLARHSDTPW